MPLLVNQWECQACGWSNGFLRTKCRNCQRLKGEPMLEPKVKICDLCKGSGHSRAEHEAWERSQAKNTIPSPGSEPSPSPVTDDDQAWGTDMMQRFFKKRGENNVEVHLDRETLAALLTFAYSEGRNKGRGVV